MVINVDGVNGYLETMRCLYHGCYFSLELLEHRGNFSNILRQHFQALVDSKGKYQDRIL
jgi:hypothetical protein